MKPRTSVLSVMAFTGVVALQCATLRSIAARAESPAGSIWFAAIMTLPMASLMAIVTLTRWSGPFLLGFEAFGMASLVASVAWFDRIAAFLEFFLRSVGIAESIEASPTLTKITVYGVLPAGFFFAQLLLALIGGNLVRRFVPPREAVDRPRSWRLALLALLVAIPLVSTQGYLRLKVDPELERLPVGTIAVVDFRRIPEFPILPPKGSPIANFDGSRVRIEADSEPMMFEKCMSADGTEHFRNRRAVRVTPVDGGKAGEPILVPHCALRPEI